MRPATRWRITGNARAGRKPLGLVFELAAGDVPGQVPPQAIREIGRLPGHRQGRNVPNAFGRRLPAQGSTR